jgi:hypothetical protein
MKTKNPSPYFLSPHMSEAQVEEFCNNMLREKFGPQAEQLIMFSTILKQVMALPKKGNTVQPNRSQK